MGKKAVNLTLKEEKYVDDQARKRYTKRDWHGRKEKFRDVFRNLDMKEVMKEMTIMNMVVEDPEYTPSELELKARNLRSNSIMDGPTELKLKTQNSNSMISVPMEFKVQP